MKKRALVILALIALPLVLTSCAQPSKIYAADKKEGVYFSLPRGWTKVSQKALNARESLSTAAGAAERAASVLWQEAYSLDSNITAADVLSLKTPQKPLVYVRVRSLLGPEINSVSYNSLRDLVVPITEWVNGTKTAPAFDISNDEERVENGARGVHSVFHFAQSDGTNQTIDQISLLSNDHSTIYALLIRCSTNCYETNHKILESISASFTVRGKK
jgi:hypothetical protein